MNEFYCWDDVPVGVVLVDSKRALVWVKQENGDAICNSAENPADSGWVNFGSTPPHSKRYPLTVVTS